MKLKQIREPTVKRVSSKMLDLEQRNVFFDRLAKIEPPAQGKTTIHLEDGGNLVISLLPQVGVPGAKLMAETVIPIEVDLERRNNILLMNLVFPEKLIAITTSARNNPASFVLRMGLLVTPACPDIGTLTLEAQYVATKLHFLHNLGLAEKSTIPSIAIEALRLLFVQGRVIPEGERERFTRDAITALRLSEGMPEFAGLLADRKGEFYTLKSARNAMTLLTNL